MRRDGIRLVCHDWGGPGLPVVLLHGLAGHAGEWDEIARRLRDRFRVVAVDQRGHGASERQPRDVSRAAYVADVVAVTRQLRLERPVLAGQSLGGHTAMLTAAAHPGLVRGLALIEAGTDRLDADAPREIDALLGSWPAPFPSLAAAAEFFGGGPVGAAWAAGLEEREGAWHPRFDRDVMVAALTENTQRSFDREWQQITCPTLAVFAQSSILSAPGIDTMLHGRTPTTATSIPASGHDLHLEHPELVSSLLTAFLDELARTDGPPRNRPAPPEQTGSPNRTDRLPPTQGRAGKPLPHDFPARHRGPHTSTSLNPSRTPPA
ncbi:alpha/beta fold hydrolase [Streptomyces mesophilus]|uniref:alpha/beta fold hydrolase n=1 Tax=Streptomyces mesophilus TaxID=1775132 RepID=UPI0033186731